jgi:hypothetical protein
MSTVTSGRNHTLGRLGTPTDLRTEATHDIAAALGGLLADVFSLYLNTKNFHWHMSGRHFRGYHLMLDEHGAVLVVAPYCPVVENPSPFVGIVAVTPAFH